MPKTKQFTIRVENRPGAVAHIARALGDRRVNILALRATAEAAKGTVQLVAEDSLRAKTALEDADIVYTETVAEEHELPNKPGALAELLERLAARGINLSTVYATAAKGGRKAIVVYSAESEQAEKTTAA
jgi:hypothetical protein